MLTDPAPHNSDLTGFRESDRMTTLELPENDGLPAIAKSIETAMKAGQTANVNGRRRVFGAGPTDLTSD